MTHMNCQTTEATGSATERAGGTKIWNAIFLLAFAFYVCSTLAVLSHVVTWCDPAWYSYNAIDFYYGRDIGTNQHIAEHIADSSPHGFAFFGYDLRMNIGWQATVAAMYKILGVSLFAANLTSFVFSLLTILVVYGIVKEIYGEAALSAQAGILLILDYQMFWMATMARPDMAAMFFGLLGIHLMLLYRRTGRRLLPFLAAVAWSIGFTMHLLMIFFPVAYMLTSQTATLWSKRGRLREYLKTSWPIILAFFLFGVFTLFYYHAYSQSLDRWVSTAGSRWSLSRGIYQEFYVKILDAFVRRYSLPLLMLFVLFVAFAVVSAIRRRNGKTLAVFGTMLCVTALGVLVDQNAGSPRLLYYSPFLALFTALGLRVVLPALRYKSLRILAVGLVVLAMLLPRALKYGQIIHNWHGTDYAAFIVAVKETIPPNSVIAGDMVLIWGLHDYGVKLIDPCYFFRDSKGIPLDRSYADNVEYVVIDDNFFEKPSEQAAFLAMFHGSLSKIADIQGRGDYGYHCKIFRHSVGRPVTNGAR